MYPWFQRKNWSLKSPFVGLKKGAEERGRFGMTSMLDIQALTHIITIHIQLLF